MSKKHHKKPTLDEMPFVGLPTRLPSKIVDLPDEREDWYTDAGMLKASVYREQLKALQFELV